MKQLIHLIGSLLVVMTIMCVFPLNRAYAVIVDGKDIKCYQQSSTAEAFMTKNQLRDNTTSIYKSGCHLCAFGHAIQYMSGENDNDYHILTGLINACCSPSDGEYGHGFNGCKNSPYSHNSSGEAYAKYAKNQYGITFVHATSSNGKEILNSKEKTIQNLEAGGTFIMHPVGHYIACIGYRYADGQDWFLMIDSSVKTTVGKTTTTYYTYDNFTEKTVPDSYYGAAYWLKWEQWKKIATEYIGIGSNHIAVSSVALDQSVLSMKAGETETLTAAISPANASNKNVVWASSNASVATVENGKITAQAAGEATITVTIEGGVKTASCQVTVAEGNNEAENEYEGWYQVTGVSQYLSINAKPASSGTSGNTTVCTDAVNGTKIHVISADGAAGTSGKWGKIDKVVLADGTLITTDGYGSMYYLRATEEPNITSGTCGDQLSWTLDENGLLTISGTGEMYDYLASSNKAPWGQTVRKAVIESGVTRIGSDAFFFCDELTDITIPDSISSIGGSAFLGCESLTSITIPSGVTNIGWGAFRCCSNLTGIHAAEDNLQYADIDGVLYDKNITELIVCPGARQVASIPSSVTSIGNYAFCECAKLTNITIPESVTSIGMQAFDGCIGLTSVTIHASVKTIHEDAFMDCENITISCFENSAAHTFAVDHSIPYMLLDTPLNNPDFVVPGALKTIEEEAFAGIAAKRVKLSEDTASIGSMAFAGCPNLVGIYIPAKCTTIAADAFQGVSNLTIYAPAGSEAASYATSNSYVLVTTDQ